MSSSSSSSAVPEKVLAAANNERLLVTRSGLAVAIVASLNGGLVVSEDQAAVISSAMEVATYNFRHANAANASIGGADLVARTLGVRLKLVEFRGTRANIGTPSEMAYGPVNGPEVRIISLDSKARARVEYFSFVGPVFNNDLLTQANLNALLRIMGGNEPHIQFAALLENQEEEEESILNTNAMEVPSSASSTAITSTTSASSDRVESSCDMEITTSPNKNNDSVKKNSDSNSKSNFSGQPSLQDLYAEVVKLQQQLNTKASPLTPVRFGSLSDVANSPGQNSQISNMSMMGFSAATPIYLEKVSSAEVRSFRQKMLMHIWPNPYFRYVHHSIFEYVKGQWNVFAETSTRAIPRFEDSAGMPAEMWFDTLEEVVAEVKFDEEGISAPCLQVSTHNGLPVSIELFMQNLWKWHSKQERMHSRPSIRQQIIATLEKCPFAQRLAEVHNLRLAEADPQYPPRRLVSKINEIVTNLSGAGQHVSEFVKLKNSGSSAKNPPPAGIGKSFKGAGGHNSGKNAANGFGGGSKDGKDKDKVKDKDKDKPDADSTSKFAIKCHECGKEGHRRGDTVCEKYDPKLASKKRANEATLKAGKK